MTSSSDTGAESMVLQRKIEALLFASDNPLSVGKLAELTGASSTRTIRSALEALGGFYREHARSFEIVEVAGGYQINTLPEFSGIVTSLFKRRRKQRLSQPALETLAIIAYKQPINRTEIEAIRGVNCDGVLATLTERELITITGRGEGVGRPYLYSTTRKFLEYLGLKDYRDLPSMEELERNLEQINLFTQQGVETSAEGAEKESQEPPAEEKEPDRNSEDG